MEKHEFRIPTKKIDDPHTLEVFKTSEACKELTQFIAALAESVKGVRMSDTSLPEVRAIAESSRNNSYMFLFHGGIDFETCV